MKTFREKLSSLINCHSKENGSDTPDFILAEYLGDCLVAFDNATKRRNEWYEPHEEKQKMMSKEDAERLKMVQLEARATETDIIISKDSFEHLLNCLDNQKYAGEVNADALDSLSTEDIHDVQDNIQTAIDDFNRQCRQVLHDLG